MAYAAWSVIAGEQPTTAKWNILGTNDASFNDGTGIADLAIATAKLADKAVTSRKMGITSGTSRATDAATGLGTSAADIPGLVTPTITPSNDCTIFVQANLEVGGANATVNFAGTVLQSSDGGGSYPVDLSSTFGAAMVTQMPSDGQRKFVSATFERTLTAGVDYRFKVQGASLGVANGNVFQSLQTCLYWHIVR